MSNVEGNHTVYYMAPGRPRLAETDLVAQAHRAMLELGLPTGVEIPREDFEDLIILAFGVGSRQAIQGKIRVGQAGGLWSVREAHGKGGRGAITVYRDYNEYVDAVT